MPNPRHVTILQVVQEYLEEEIEKYPPLQRVLDALIYRISRQPEVGARVPHPGSPRFLVKSIYRHPIPCVLTLLYQHTDREVIIELAKVDG